jgi:hypothetical protein
MAMYSRTSGVLETANGVSSSMGNLSLRTAMTFHCASPFLRE